MAGEQSQIDFRDYRIFIADDAGEKLVSLLQQPQKVVPHLLLDCPGSPSAVA